MITLRKLAGLPEGTRRRKTAVLLRRLEEDLKRGEFDERYLRGLASQITADEGLPGTLRDAAGGLEARLREDAAAQELLWTLNDLRHRLLVHLGTAPADWDLPGAESADFGSPVPLTLYLDGIRSPFNVGSLFRTAVCFGFREILLAPGTASPDHPRARRSAMGCIDRIPWSFRSVEDLLPPVFALETGGVPLGAFPFPEEGTVILGSEELGISPAARKRTGEDGGLVSITLPGGKASLNVSVAFGILAHAWVDALSVRA